MPVRVGGTASLPSAGRPRSGVIEAGPVTRWLEAGAWLAAGAGFVWLGAQRGQARLWTAAAFALGFAIALRISWRSLRRPAPRTPLTAMVTYDDRGVARRLADGRVESIRWDQLAEVAIVTTDEGPFVDDVHWLLIGSDGTTGCAVPSETEGTADLLERLQKLPGFDNEAVIKAMGHTENARFVVWRRPAQP